MMNYLNIRVHNVLTVQIIEEDLKCAKRGDNPNAK
jgi:hypothetical protein